MKLINCKKFLKLRKWLKLRRPNGARHVDFPTFLKMDSTTFDGSIKRLSVSSRTSINPTQGLIPQSPTDLYLKRFQGWTSVVKNLVRFFEIQVDQERRSCESQLRITKELTLASPHLFEEEESFQVRDLNS